MMPGRDLQTDLKTLMCLPMDPTAEANPIDLIAHHAVRRAIEAEAAAGTLQFELAKAREANRQLRVKIENALTYPMPVMRIKKILEGGQDETSPGNDAIGHS